MSSSEDDEQLLDDGNIVGEEIDSAEEDDSDAGAGTASKEDSSEEDEEGDSDDEVDNIGEAKRTANSKAGETDSESEEEGSLDEDEEEASGSGSDESEERSMPAPPPAVQASKPKKGTKAASAEASSSGKPNPPSNPEHAEEQEEEEAPDTWEGLGLVAPLCEATRRLGWSTPSEIQRASLVHALAGRDIIGLAETGSGKTGAFALPILQALLAAPQRLFAVCLAPTRELAFQIHESFEGLGSGIGLSSCCVVGGVDMVTQAIALAKRPHVVVGTPGRLVDHIENTKGFSLRTVRFLVMDEADRMLSMDFEEELNKILASLPANSSGGGARSTYLFSATMTSKVAKLQRASLHRPVKVEVSHKFATPKSLVQQYCFVPAKHKDCYLAYVLNEFAGQTILVFAATCNGTQRLALLLRNLGFDATCLHGQMSQPKRLGALNKFKSKQRSILIATDVASRGLDIPAVDVVVNFDIPTNGKEYIHRVGRTARAGRAGRSLAFVTQYDVEVYQRLEVLLGNKLPEFPADEETVLVMLERVTEAQRIAGRELREAQASGEYGGKGNKKRGRASSEGGENEGSDAYTKNVDMVDKRGGGGGKGKKGKFGGKGKGKGKGR